MEKKTEYPYLNNKQNASEIPDMTGSYEDTLTKTITRQVISALGRLTLKEALALISRAEEKASAIQVPMVLTVVDEGGNLMAQHRMDDALLASISISHAKAYTALALRCATSEAAKSILPGQSLYGLQETHPGKFCLFGGGIPIFRSGRCIGGLGVSGGTVEQDTAVAEYAMELMNL